MIEIIKQQLKADMSSEEKLNRTRELLQIVCLKIIYEMNMLSSMAFTGGTALRILFDMRRFSEDLDFSLINKGGFDFAKVVSELIRGFELSGLKVESDPKKESDVQGTFLKFRGLMKEVGISPLASQVLSIKIEVDTNPPPGGDTTTTYVNKIYPLTITHFDLPSMFATKLHACFYRKYAKGRDFYDLLWYIGRKVSPNYMLLNNAIKQTQGTAPGITTSNLKQFLLEKVEKLDFIALKKDVERFLEDKSELALLDYKVIKSSIELFY
jgi:predicted nucleotidyltransferase component of viral defense system